jgi:hypothetical protein
MDWENGRVSCFMGPGNTLCRDWIVFPTVLRDGYTDPTLMASRWFVAAANNSQGQEFIAGAAIGIGLIVWSSKDDSIPSAAATPLPLSDGELDWVNRWVIPIPQGQSSLETIYNELDNVHLSKAKRRLGQDNGILLVAETKLLSNSWGISTDVRCLIKE